MKLRGGPKPIAPGATHRRAAGNAGSRTAAAVWGALGWLALLGVLGAAVALQASQRRSIAATRARFAPAVAEIQASVASRTAELSRERVALTAAINDPVKHQEEVLLQTRTAEQAVRELEPQAKTLERARGQLQGTVGTLQAGQARTDADLNALAGRLAGLEQTRDRLQNEYKAHFRALRLAFEAAKDAADPDLLRRFYAEHRDSAFAPAAAYHTAEKLYAGKRSAEALRLYKEAVRLYPGSAYAEPCTARIAQIDAGAKYSEPPAAVPFEPYLPELGARAGKRSPEEPATAP